jgi:hypothetical protein
LRHIKEYERSVQPTTLGAPDQCFVTKHHRVGQIGDRLKNRGQGAVANDGVEFVDILGYLKVDAVHCGYRYFWVRKVLDVEKGRQFMCKDYYNPVDLA